MAIDLQEEALHQETSRIACLEASLVKPGYLENQSTRKKCFSRRARMKRAQFMRSLVLLK
jgi:hypothetical protein